jgi:hypothetical protein
VDIVSGSRKKFIFGVIFKVHDGSEGKRDTIAVAVVISVVFGTRGEMRGGKSCVK